MTVGTRLLAGVDGRRYEFDPGSFCLELLLTGGPGALARQEMLRGPADFSEWLIDSRLALIAPLAIDDLRIRPAELREIRQFRDTLWSVARTVAGGGWPAADDLELVNAYAGASAQPAIDPDTGDRCWAVPITGSQVLGTAARDAIELLADDNHTRVRICEGDDCQLVFADTSRPGTRRWCAMSRCGNRSKVRAYRERGSG